MNRFPGLPVLVLLILASVSPSNAVANALECPYTNVSPTIDGDLNESAWENATAAVGFLGHRTLEPARQPTEAYFMHDGDYLYFAAISHHGRSLEPEAQVAEAGGPVWHDDAVELFVCPDPDEASPVFQIALNSLGTIFDLAVRDGERDREWDSQAKVAAHQAETFWRIEVAIPLTSLELESIDQVAFNVTRQHNYVNRPTARSTWAPVEGGSFHDPSYYASLAFLGEGIEASARQYSFQDYAPRLFNNYFELGVTGWEADNGVRIVENGGAYGWICELGGTSGQEINIRQNAPVKAGHPYTLRAHLKYEALQTPNHRPFRLVFYDRENKRIDSTYAVGLGNMGGTSEEWAPYQYSFVVPEYAQTVDVVGRQEGKGTIWFSAIRLNAGEGDGRPQPVLKEPKNQSVLYAPPVFNWDFFEDRDPEPGTFTLELSQEPDFPSGKTKRVRGVYAEWELHERLENGIWHWRIRFDGENDSAWSNPNQFELNITEENEQIEPVIDSYSPRLASDPDSANPIRVRWHDPEPSSGIDQESVQILIDGEPRSDEASIDANGLELAWEPSEQPRQVTVRVADHNGNQAEISWIASAGSAPTTGVDEEGFIQVNGERFFPIALYGVTNRNSFGILAKEGFNTILSPWGEPQRYLQAGYEHNMFIGIYRPGPGLITEGMVSVDTPAGQREMTCQVEQIRKIVDHPKLLCYYLGDESADHGVIPDKLGIWNEKLKEVDPRRFTTWLPTYRRESVEHIWGPAAEVCDILLRDDYPLFRGASYSILVDNIRRVQRWTDNKPIWHIIEAFDRRDAGRSGEGRHPTRAELRYQAYSAIVTGGRGVCFYTAPKRRNFSGSNPYADTDRPGFQEDLFSVAAELNDLHDVLVTDENREMVRVRDDDELAWTVKPKEDTTWLFVVNTSENPRLFRVEVLGGESAMVYGEDHVIDMKDGEFEDELDGIHARVYRITR